MTATHAHFLVEAGLAEPELPALDAGLGMCMQQLATRIQDILATRLSQGG